MADTIARALAIALEGGGGGGEPDQYIKNATVSDDGNTLTLTKKSGSIVDFTPAGSEVSVSATGTATDEVSYITIDGVEKKIAGGSIADKQYTSLERLGNYLYKVTFETIPERNDIDNNISGGCTSFVRDGKLYRNLDWYYSNLAEFIVITKNFKGMAFINDMNDEELDDAKIAQLPYFINDGVNNNGIMVSAHVLTNDWGYTGSGKQNVNLTDIPYLLLSELRSTADLPDFMLSYLSNVKVNDSLISSGMLMQFIVTDGTSTYVIVPPETSTGEYQLLPASRRAKLTNFRWVDRAVVSRNESDIQLHPTGIERWNLIENDSTTLEDLKFTLCYENDTRLSEFIGMNNTTKDSSDSELLTCYEEARAEYRSRNRDNPISWQTVHSIVYANKDIETLYIQEDYDVNYGKPKSSGGGTSDYRDLENKPSINDVQLVGNVSLSDIGVPVYTAGHNIEISHNEISATDTTYSASNGIIIENNTISIDNTVALKSEIPTVPTNVSAFTNDAGYLTAHQDISNLATKTELQAVEAEIPDITGLATETYVNNAVATKQDILTAGSNISISGTTISATDTTYTAGTGINISAANAVSVDNTIALKSEIPDVSDFATEDYVDNAVATKQDTLTAGTGISLTSNTVSYLGTVLYATFDSSTGTLNLSTTA